MDGEFDSGGLPSPSQHEVIQREPPAPDRHGRADDELQPLLADLTTATTSAYGSTTMLLPSPRRDAARSLSQSKRLVVGAVVILAVFAALTYIYPVFVTPPPRLKIMIAGDSITQGFEGDYTWRYRLWEWFQSNGIAVDFVGPYTGTNSLVEPTAPQPPRWITDDEPPPPPPRTTGGYAADISSDFDGDHFGVWGRRVQYDRGLIAGLVRTYRPEYLLVELGFNDLGWSSIGPEGTLENMRKFVENARATKPDIKFAIANIPQRTALSSRPDLPGQTDQYNRLLAAAIPTWSTDISPIHLVQVRENYDCENAGCPAGHDGLHPNSLGEFQVARIFTQVLHDAYKIGRGPLIVPLSIPHRPCSVSPNVNATTTPSGIALTWDGVYGAYGYDVRSRIKGSNIWAEQYILASRYDTKWSVDGSEWEYQIRPACGDGVESSWSSVVSAVVHLETAPWPENIVLHGTPDGYMVSWSPPTGDYSIDRYELLRADRDAGSGISSVGVSSTSAILTGLPKGHRYSIALATWTDKGGGLPSFSTARTVTAGFGTPPAPKNLEVITTDSTAVHLTWTGDVSAAGYRLWIRDINDRAASKDYGEMTGVPCWDISNLTQKAWNFEFCVSAFNGNDESEKSNCVIAPKSQTPISDSCPIFLQLRPWELPPWA